VNLIESGISHEFTAIPDHIIKDPISYPLESVHRREVG